MDAYAESRESRREAVLSSLARVAPAEVEHRFREFMNEAGGALNEWDQRFPDFLAAHGAEPLLVGTLGGGFCFAFSARDSTGFWTLAARDGFRGKGFLTPHDADRLLALARLKGLAG